MRKTAIFDAVETPAVDDSCCHVGPFLVVDSLPEDVDHAVRCVGCQERDSWILLFEDGA